MNIMLKIYGLTPIDRVNNLPVDNEIKGENDGKR